MKRFNFSLEKLRSWRQTQFELEESKLETLIGQRRFLARQRAALDESEQSERLALTRSTVCSNDLIALASYLNYCERARAELAQNEARMESEIQKQRETMMEARRRVEILNSAKKQKHDEWRKEMDAEQEQAVAELVVSRWKRGAGGSS